MLGIGNIVTAGSKVANVVRRGLQAWYKADDTQAPLGEEQIANGGFLTGPNLIQHGIWLRETDGPDTGDFISGGGVVYTPGQGSISIPDTGFRFVTDASSTHMGIKQNGILSQANTDNSFYEVTYTITENNGTGGLKFNNTEIPNPPVTVGTHVVYSDSAAGLNHFLIERKHDLRVTDITIKDIQVRVVNPNSSWSEVTATGSTVTFKDGVVDLVTDGANVNIQQTILTIGKKYRAEIDITKNSGDGVKVQDGGGLAIGDISSSGLHSFDFVATNEIFLIARDGSNAGDYTVNSVSVKEITNSVKDFSPNSNDAVLYSGTALDFDGDATNPDYIALDYPPASTAISASSKYTIACWFNAATLGSFMVFSNGQGGDNRLYLWTASNQLFFNWGDKSGSVSTGTAPTVVADRWYRFVAVLDGLTATVYLDGEQQYTRVSSSAFNLEDNIHIGRHGSANGFAYDGMVSDFQVYDACWNATDVKYDWENPDKDVFDDEGRAEVLGVELTTNGDFSTSGTLSGSSYDLGVYDGGSDTGITISNGHLNLFRELVGPGDNGGRAYLSNGVNGKIVIPTGVTYKFEYSITENTSSSILNIWDGYKYAVIDNTVGEHIYYFHFNPTGYDGVILRNNGALESTIKISSISLKQVTTHASHVSPTDCKTLLRLNEGAGTRLYDAAPVLGDNLLSGNNSTFDGANNWAEYSETGTTGVSASDGILTVTLSGEAGANTDSGAQIANTYNGFSINKLYLVSADIWLGTATATDFKIWMGADFINISPTTNRTTFSGYLKPTNTGTLKIFENKTGGDSGTFFVDNVSVKEIILSNSFAYVDGSNNTTEWKTAQPYIPQLAMSSYSKKIFFDGVDDWVSNANSLLGVSRLKNYSISLWFVPYTLPDSSEEDRQGLFQNSHSGSDRNAISIFQDGTVRAGHYGDTESGAGETLGWRSASSDSSVELGKLHHVVYTNEAYDPGGSNGTKLYINGVLQSGTSNSYTSDATGIYIGKNTNATERTNSLMDEVSVFSKTLSQTEVQEIFNSGTALDVREHSCYYGDDLIQRTNGVLDASDWTLDPHNGSSIVDGVINFNRSNDTYVYQSVLTQGKRYRATFSGTITSGSIYVGQNGDSTYLFPVGTYDNESFVFEASLSDAKLIIRRLNDPAGSTLVASITSISVEEVQTVGYWRNNGVDTWADLSVYGNDCTVSGSPTTIQLQEVPYFKKDSFGLPMNKVRQRALNFDGQSYVEIDDNNSLDFGTGPFTIEAWAKAKYLDKGSTVNVIFSLGGNVSDDSHNTAGLVMFSTGKFGAYVDGQNFDADDIAVEGLWYHIALRRNSSGVCALYINGEQQTDHTPTIANTITNALNPRIGADSNLQRCYHSLIDDVKVYNILLSTAQINTNFKATKSKHKNNTISNWSDDFSDSFI